MTAFWVSFWDNSAHLKTFEYHGPWWVTGTRGGWCEGDDEQESICAAVMAEDEESAKREIVSAYDKKDGPVEWRFVSAKPESWNPMANVSGRFEPAPWMQWPFPPVPSKSTGEK